MAIGRRISERKRTLRLASSSSEEEENELSGEASNFGEKEKTITEVIEDDPNEILFPISIAESGQATEVEEGEVTDATRSELETFVYEQSEEEKGEVIREKVPIQGEASCEMSKRKTRSGQVVKRPEWLGQNVMVSAIERKKSDEEPEK